VKSEFTAMEIYEALGIPRERLRAWMKLGFIKPSLPAAGQGVTAKFTLLDVHGIALFSHLISYGFSRSTAGAFVKQLFKVEKEKRQEVEYIYVRESVSDKGKVRKGIFALDAKEAMFALATGLTPSMEMEAKKSAHKDYALADKEWLNIHVVNFGALRKRVNQLLEKI